MSDDCLHEDTGDMLSVEEALQQVLDLARRLDVQEVALADALGAVLAEDLVAGFAIPPFDNSGMDGYAVRRADAAAAVEDRPLTLPVVGEIAAGQEPGARLAVGTAVRIMTGAPVPTGADAVIPFENTDEEERKRRGEELDHIGLRVVPRERANIRAAGEDIAQGAVVLQRGRLLAPADIGIAASVGRTRLTVVRRPVVAVISTGDEIVEPGEQLRPGTIYDSNSHTLGALVRWYGGIPDLLGIARDNEASLNAFIDRALGADLVVTSAGVSRGEYDVVKAVLAARGRIASRSVRMKPARPLAFGSLISGRRSIPHIGLPGNPVAVVVAFETFVRPAILNMRGIGDHAHRRVQATLDAGIANRDHRRVYSRVVVYESEDGSGLRARPSGAQGSGILTAAAAANGFAICPEHLERLDPGDQVTVEMLDWDAPPTGLDPTR